MNQKQNILFLSFELSGYFMACVKALVQNHQVTAHIIRYPINPTAPFKFNDYDNVQFYERKKYNQSELIELANRINPKIIVCSGWSDKEYLKICKGFYSDIPTVLTFDNPWTGSVKQITYSKIAPLYFKNIFSCAWVPGDKHKIFAKKLGFKNSEIRSGLYSADFDLFHNQYLANREKKQKRFPHRILYVGRYTELKGVIEMWQAFVEWQSESKNDWELWCLGKGDLESEFPKHDKVKDFGFVQPHELSKYIADCGVFILPSQIEHWGVVVHEYAAAGFPLISNSNTNAANFFLKDKYNGFVHKAKNKNSIKKAFNLLLQTSDSDLFNMGERSVDMAKLITPTSWSNTVIELINNK